MLRGNSGDSSTGLTRSGFGRSQGGTLFRQVVRLRRRRSPPAEPGPPRGHDNLSQLYAYDGLDRLANRRRAQLKPANDAIVGPLLVGHLKSQTWPT
jgi:hypothetical protein